MNAKTRFFAIFLVFALAFSTVGAVPARADTPLIGELRCSLSTNWTLLGSATQDTGWSFFYFYSFSTLYCK